MTSDLTLFALDAPSHRDDPDTSRQAALSVNRGTQRFRVLAALVHAGAYGRTDSELGDELRIRETAAGTRRHELEQLGYSERLPKTRLTHYGNPAIVHAATPAGAAAWARIIHSPLVEGPE